tara:strand:- start:257 stop:598 length:342 start_codon:yes stop_codon:yes gene_type:complete
MLLLARGREPRLKKSKNGPCQQTFREKTDAATNTSCRKGEKKTKSQTRREGSKKKPTIIGAKSASPPIIKLKPLVRSIEMQRVTLTQVIIAITSTTKSITRHGGDLTLRFVMW